MTTTCASASAPSASFTKFAMATPKYSNQQQSLRSSQPPFSLAIPATMSYENESIKATTSPFGVPLAVPVLISGIPPNSTKDTVNLMMVWAEDVAGIEILPEAEGKVCSAIVSFKTLASANQAKNMLDGKQNMSVEVLGHGPKNYGVESAANGSPAMPSANSVGPTSRQPSRFNGAFPGKVSPPMNGYSATELPNPEESSRYQSLFSPQSPIGSHLTERTRISGKSLIKNDAADDDETGELLKDPVAYAENGAATSQRRATAPHLPISQLSSLSLNTSGASGPSSLPPYGHQNLLSGHHSAMSPTSMNGSGHGMPYTMGTPYGRHANFPPVNPADQNPPCNTLYVGNLPIDTSEEELKAMFSKQRGYKRLCFRTKQNGPMCFVEFEDVTFATKALNDLYGQPLHNSVKGGIRLSFSKNPLGVRSGQTTSQASTTSMASMMAGAANGFTTANGPPPGLSAPPGLGSGRFSGSFNNGQSYTPAGFSGNGNGLSNPWNSYSGMASGSPNPMMGNNGSSASYLAPHMMGR